MFLCVVALQYCLLTGVTVIAMIWYGPLPFRIPNTLYKPSALFMLCILCVVQVLSDLEMKVEGLREEEGRLRVACQERERQRAALEADTLTSDPLREVYSERLIATVWKMRVYIHVLVCVWCSVL